MIMKPNEGNHVKLLTSAVLMILLAVASALPAQAETAWETAAAGYGYLDGQQQSQARRALFETKESLTTDEARAAFYAENDIGGD